MNSFLDSLLLLAKKSVKTPGTYKGKWRTFTTSKKSFTSVKLFENHQCYIVIKTLKKSSPGLGLLDEDPGVGVARPPQGHLAQSDKPQPPKKLWHPGICFSLTTLIPFLLLVRAIEHSLEGQKCYRPQSYPYPYTIMPHILSHWTLNEQVADQFKLKALKLGSRWPQHKIFETYLLIIILPLYQNTLTQRFCSKYKNKHETTWNIIQPTNGQTERLTKVGILDACVLWYDQ